jgi:hypothetical protein
MLNSENSKIFIRNFINNNKNIVNFIVNSEKSLLENTIENDSILLSNNTVQKTINLFNSLKKKEFSKISEFLDISKMLTLNNKKNNRFLNENSKNIEKKLNKYVSLPFNDIELGSDLWKKKFKKNLNKKQKTTKILYKNNLFKKIFKINFLSNNTVNINYNRYFLNNNYFNLFNKYFT